MAEEATEIAQVAEEPDDIPTPGLNPVVYREYALMAEYNLLSKQTLDGIYITPKSTNPYEWMGVLFVRRGYYQGGIFRFLLKIPNEFPDCTELPVLTFDRSLYHPFVDPDKRSLDLCRYFPEGWKWNTHHLYHIFMVLQRSFYKLDTVGAVNKDAANLYEKDRDKFRNKVTDCVRRSREVVYDTPTNDINSIRFSPWDPNVHESIRNKMTGGANQVGANDSPRLRYGIDARKSGLSWVDPDALYILAKNQSHLPPSMIQSTSSGV